ncbi:MAG: hypothetical protein GX572_04135 [Clostridia bacterium]|nr:hypothetical protein [Clostridia bacterium]
MQFIDARQALNNLLEDNQSIGGLQIKVTSRALKNEEAIGHPERGDFPLLRGKEVLLQAEIDGYKGQAFTSDPIAWQGDIKRLAALPVDRPGNYALMVAALNALARKLGLAGHTIHCRDQEPEQCAPQIASALREQYGLCRVGIVGYQPAIIDNCVREFGAEHVRVTDLDRDNVGSVRYGVEIWDGLRDTGRLIDFADVLLITGSILANGTAEDVLAAVEKPVYFYGTTCAALAHFNQFNRLCPLSR